MIATRRKFLTAFFASLEANGVRYCILRNYDNLYGDASTDLDMLISSHSLPRFERCLREAAAGADFHFVHAARYVNYSQVFWHPVGGFVRVDFEIDVRWRLFTALTAREVLDARQRHQEFFIPKPEHESIILFVAAIWRGLMSDRYRKQLALLYEQCPDKTALRHALIKAFGGGGDLLADFQARTENAVFDTAFCRRVRWYLVLLAHLSWSRAVSLLQNTWTDVLRILGRLRRPAGMSLLYASSYAQPQKFDDLLQRINFLFPEKKCVIETTDLRQELLPEARWTWAKRWKRGRTMFKGGLFVHAYQVARDEDVPRIARSHARFVYPERTFVCAEDSTGRLYFGHVASGFMSTTEPAAAETGKAFSQRFIEFVSDILERSNRSFTSTKPQRGLFCALVGLDGSGKTTLGRNLCDVALVGKRFEGVRYFHWRPKALETVEFPLPEFRNTPRKVALQPTFANQLLSIARLMKAVTLANLAWHFRVRRLLKYGYLVIVDRYFYNYLLDPASVKFAGPQWALRLARKLFPRPHAVIVLRAPKEVLLQRKQELSSEEAAKQATALDAITFETPQVVRADASLGASEIAQTIMKELVVTVTTH